MSFISTLKNELRSVVIISVVAFVVFANSLGGSFVYDDKRQIVQNPLIQSSELYGRALRSDVWAFKGSEKFAGSNYWRPTFTAWSIVNFRLFGTSPFGWHLTNVLLHIAVCLLAYFLLLKWRIPKMASLLITLIFAVHPVHVESVAWISGSPDLLMAASLLGSFLLIGAEGGRRTLRYIFAALLFAVALGAKEVAIAALPIYALIFGLNSDKEGETEGWKLDLASIKYVVPFAVVGGLYLAGRQMVIGSFALPVDDAASVTSAILTAPAAMFFYLMQSLLPYGLGPNYPLRPVESFSLSGVISPAVSAALFFFVGWAIIKQSARTAAIGAAIFLFLLAPALYISAFPREQIVHDRYLYLPLLGLLIVVYFALKKIADHSARAAKVIPWAVGAIAVVLSIQTISYNSVWASDASLWRHAVTIDPNSASNWQQLGAEGGGSLPLPAILEAYDRSIAIKKTPLALVGRGRNLLAARRIDDAIRDFREVVAYPPEEINAYTLFQGYEGLAVALQAGGRVTEAENELRKGRERLPIYRAAMTEQIAVVLYAQGKKAEALQELESARSTAATEMLPASAKVYLRLGMLYLETRRNAEASSAFKTFLDRTSNTIDPDMIAFRKIATDGLTQSSRAR